MFNKAILIGRLTAEPERKVTQAGVTVANSCVAVDRPYKNEGGERKTDFINVNVWRQQADFLCKYFHKGDPVGIEGSIQTKSYDDKDGNKRWTVEVLADNVFFVGGRAGAATAEAAEILPKEETT